MKITFQNPSDNRTEALETKGQYKQEAPVSRKHFTACRFTPMSSLDKSFFVGEKANRQKTASLSDIQNEAAQVDAAIQQDYMTLMSNTLSKEDYARLEQEGFHFADLEPEMAVTIVDKIKAELVRSGQCIPGYTDDLDLGVLSEALGSETLARAVEQSFAQADIPLSKETAAQVTLAWDMSQKLKTPTEGAYHYMVDNGLDPEIQNFYLAQSCGAGEGESGQSRYYAEDIQGYYTQTAVLKNVSDVSAEGLSEQIDRVIVQAGMEVDEKSRQEALWLLEQNLPLTPENLQCFRELSRVAFPVTEEVFSGAVANAVAEGKSPLQSLLTDTENIYKKAEAVLQQLTDRIRLEEVRLRLTAEVNLKLLKSGFAIDTAPVEQLLSAIRKAEEEIALAYFPDDSQALAKYESYQTATQVVSQLPEMPAALLGGLKVLGEGAESLQSFHAKGKALQSSYEQAHESYEALMTAPRKDLGDSLNKAFVNVDDILQDLEYAISPENQRAVRILGYNRMEITPQQIELVKAADKAVHSVIEKMTPAATLQMIRDGVNPLNQSFEELEQYFTEHSGTYEESAESYSRFLYGLERRGDISEEERQSYIGIYRLLHQIEKNDGAAIGALVNSQAELHFANLLSAVRTGQWKHQDVRVTDELGVLEQLIRTGETIPEQIAMGIRKTAQSILTEVSYTEEDLRQYFDMEWQQLRGAGEASKESIALLERGEVPINAGNLLAAQALTAAGSSLYKGLKERLTDRTVGRAGDLQVPVEDSDSTMEKLLQAWEKLDSPEGFGESFYSILSEAGNKLEELSLMQADTSVDVREMKLLHKQLSVVGALAEREEYILPMYMGRELARVHITFRRNEEQRGSVRIVADFGEDSRIEAHLQIKDNQLSGFLVGNTPSEVMKLKQAADIFSKSLQEKQGQLLLPETLPIVDARHAAFAEERMTQTRDGNLEAGGPANAQLYQVAKLFLQATAGNEVAYEN